MRIGEEISERWLDVKVVIMYCVGWLEIMDIVVVIVVLLLYCKVVYEVNEYVIECIKWIVLIWKKEFWEDGMMWVGD